VASGAADRRGPIIGAVVVGIIVALAVLRELLAPEAHIVPSGADLLGPTSAERNFARPLGLLIAIVGELAALGVLARALDRRGWRPLWHVVAAAGLAITMGTIYAVLLKSALQLEEPITRAVVAGPIGGMQIYALWTLAFRYPQVADDARVRALDAERLRQAAELSRLREHLQPHFLRNTLNAIAAFVSEDPDAARDLLAALGDLLSETLESDGPMHTLNEETAWLRRYAEIFEARHRGALHFVWDLDPAASSIQIPRLLLQPLVENAVRHGALARADEGVVTVQTRRAARGGMIVIQDDGPGIDPRRSEGLGLHLVRRRLAIECPDATFRIESSASGTRVVIELR